MDINAILLSYPTLQSPAVFAICVALAALMVWRSFMPAQKKTDDSGRLDNYLTRGEVAVAGEEQEAFVGFALKSVFRQFLRALGRLMPQRNVDMMRLMLQQAGDPGKLTVLDFTGLRLFSVALVGTGFYIIVGRSQPFTQGVLNSVAVGAVGYFLPTYWLKNRAKKRQKEILRSIPDAIDMLTIGVEAGLAFESALLRVGEKWDNALTREFRRAVTGMQIGMTRERALVRMAERANVDELSAFVSVLVQSAQLGVSIAEVMHAQAAEMRLKRRQRAEELARQAGVKMVFPLALFILPSLFVVILGPAMPGIMEGLNNMSGV